MNTAEQARQIQRIRTEFQDIYGTLKWIDAPGAARAEEERSRLVSEIEKDPASRWEFAATKLVAHDLSPGCRICGQGDWSCLFINNLCNARCFYCPASQTQLDQPATGRLEFSDPRDYADYVEAFGIQGVSFSGGEPLISLDRVMAFLTTLRQRISRPLYTWMYTNGILASKEKFQALAEAGLDELRFDLSANSYSLEGLKKAIGVIPRVTVEIPAIPEDVDRLKTLLPQLASLGVNYLNLHQIRGTRFNSRNLADRGYHFAHGPGITVPATELAALELIRHTLEHDICLPVNYCAFTFRHQFQRAGAQKRNAALAKASYESITPTGQIRTLTLQGDPEDIKHVTNQLTEKDPALWEITPKGERLYLHSDLLAGLDPGNLSLKILHSGTSLGPQVSYRHRFKEIRLNQNKTVVVERFPRHQGVDLSGDQISRYAANCLETPGCRSQTTADGLPESLEALETFVPGLAPYF